MNEDFLTTGRETLVIHFLKPNKSGKLPQDPVAYCFDQLLMQITTGRETFVIHFLKPNKSGKLAQDPVAYCFDQLLMQITRMHGELSHHVAFGVKKSYLNFIV